MLGVKKGIMGFHGVAEFGDSFFGLDHPTLNAWFSLAAAVVTAITGFMWDSPHAIYTLWILMGVDWVTGIMCALRSKTFTSARLGRIILYFVLTSVMLGISWHLAKASFVFTPLPAMVYGGFCSVYFVSLLENFTKLGAIPRTLRNILVERLGLQNVIEKAEGLDKSEKTEKSEEDEAAPL